MMPHLWPGNLGGEAATHQDVEVSERDQQWRGHCPGFGAEGRGTEGPSKRKRRRKGHNQVLRRQARVDPSES